MKLIALDIETWGLKEGYTLQPWQCASNEAGILSVAIANKGGNMLVSDCDSTLNFIESFNSITDCKCENPVICGWNLKFDLAFLLTCGHNYFKNYIYLDGMLLLKRLEQDLESYSLKNTLKRYSKHIPNYVDGYHADIEFKVGKPSEVYTQEELLKMHKYNIKDAEYTYFLVRHLVAKATPQCLAQAIRESTLCVYFAESWTNGLHLDDSAIANFEKSIVAKLNKFDKLFTTIGLTKKIINSTKQLPIFLTEKLNITLSDLTEKGALAVNQTVLKKILYQSSGIPQKIIKSILMYKSLETELTKFIASAKSCYVNYRKAHSDPMLNSTYTGRITYSIHQSIKKEKTYKNGSIKITNKKITIGLPIHQMKRGKIRNILIAPPGHDLLELDFCAQEMRLMACIASESTMIKLFNENKDLHSYTAAEIVGITYKEFKALAQSDPDAYKRSRFIGKLTNLSLQYRLSAKNLYRQWHIVYGITDKTESDAIIAKNTYLKIYSGIGRYWNSIIEFAKRTGYVNNLAERKRYISEWGYEHSWKSEQTAINFPIQSAGAEQKVLALFSLRKFIDKNNVKFAWDLHDGLYFYVPIANQQEVVHDMVTIMSNLDYKKAWFWEPQLKFPVEAKIGKNWGELKIVK